MINVVSLILIFSVLLLPSAPLQSSAPTKKALDEQIRKITEAQLYSHSSWGIAVADASSGTVLYEMNADKLFHTASTAKLFSTAAVLDAFGADYRFITPIYRRGDVDGDGNLRGELILRAAGDPNLSGRADSHGRLLFTSVDHTYATVFNDAALTPTNPLAGIDDLAKQVAASGIRSARDVLVDDRLFDLGLKSFEFPLSPVVINDNVIDVTVTPSSATGSPANILTSPQTSFAQFDNAVETVAEGSETAVQVMSVAPGRFTVRGQIAKGRKPLLKVAIIDDPSAFARTLLIERLQAHGVQIERGVKASANREPTSLPADYRSLSVVAQHASPPFSEAIKVILKVSHNPHANLLPLLLASRKGERTADAGLLLEGQFLKRVGVDVNSFSFSSGAGGTTADLVTPRAALTLLSVMARRPDAIAYHDALPVIGVDGSLIDAVVPTSPVRGKAFAKTGTEVSYDTANDKFFVISKALSGYMTTASGRKVVFALYVNNLHVNTVDEVLAQGKVLGQLCEDIYKAL